MLHNETLLNNLLSKPSVTPHDKGCIDTIESFFSQKATYLHKGNTHNALLSFGEGKQSLIFVGHTDVVPPGPLTKWQKDPFIYEQSDPIIARGVVDMKGAIWAFCSALLPQIPDLTHKVHILLTSDEEGDGKDGIAYVVPKLLEQGFHTNYALVGEPTSINTVGDCFKHERRGSYTLEVVLEGKQGHTAYPKNAWAPSQMIHDFFEKFLAYKATLPKDHDASLYNITSSTHTSNIIPNSIHIGVNIRYFDIAVVKEFHELFSPIAIKVIHSPGAEPYQSNPKVLKQTLIQSIDHIAAINAAPSRLGGTSDARFLSPIADEIIEFGLRSEFAHHINEQASIKELSTLREIYYHLIKTLLCKKN